MAPRTQPRKKFRVVIKDIKGAVISDHTRSESYGTAFVNFGIPTTPGESYRFRVEVRYLGDDPYKTPLAKRQVAAKKAEERAEKYRVEREEKALVLRRKRIVNQIDHAFLTHGSDAVRFVTCDKCSDVATILLLTHEHVGATVIDAEQITGALCASHEPWWRMYKTTAFIKCSRLEFFYDGIKQIYVNPEAAASGGAAV